MKKLDIKKLEKLRHSKGYSQEKLSYILGYNARGSYSMKVTGRRKFTIDDISILSDLYGCSIDALFNQEKENRKVVAAIC